MQKIIKAIIILTLSYVLLLFYAFGVFLKVPVFKSSPLTIQQILEPFFYFLMLILGFYFVFKAIYYSRKIKARFNETKLLLPSIFLLILLGIGMGIHTVAQMIEDALGHENKENFIYRLAYFLDEYPGHFSVAIPSSLLMFFLVILELNSEKINLKNFEKVILLVCSLIEGTTLVIAGFEGGGQYFVMWFLGVWLAFKILRFKEKFQLNFWQYPFTLFYILSALIFIILNTNFFLSLWI